jgi:hypothetical protein
MTECIVTQEADHICQQVDALGICVKSSYNADMSEQIKLDLPAILARRCKLKGITGAVKTDGFRISDHAVHAVPFYYETVDGFTCDPVGLLCLPAAKSCPWVFHKELPEIYTEFWLPGACAMYLKELVERAELRAKADQEAAHIVLCAKAQQKHPDEYASSCALAMLLEE